VLAPALVTGRVERMSAGTLTARNVEGTIRRRGACSPEATRKCPSPDALDPADRVLAGRERPIATSR
jgi:hypothetical protein